MRITTKHREKAKKHIELNVKDEATGKPLRELEMALREAMSAELLKRFDQKDMAVLRKYDFSSGLKQIVFKSVYPKTYVSGFSGIRIPSTYNEGEQSFNVDIFYFPSLSKEIKTYINLWQLHINANSALHRKYGELFDGCNTFKQLAPYWPECETIFPGCLDGRQRNSTALMCLSAKIWRGLKLIQIKD